MSNVATIDGQVNKLPMSDDDGFDDFLSEEEEERTLPRQEMEALARKMKTVGIREALESGKERTLQEGFDAGFAAAATAAFEFGVARGALSAAMASGLVPIATTEDDADRREIDACVEQLRLRAQRVVPAPAPAAPPSSSSSSPSPSPTTNSTGSNSTTTITDWSALSDTALLARADASLTTMGIRRPRRSMA